MARSIGQRRAAYRRGHAAEWIAILLLSLKGYRILGRRYLAKGGEIDVVALRGRVIAFVEVKARANIEAGLEAITEEKQRRFGHAVDAWLMRHPWGADYVLRCDAIVVTPRGWPRHIEDAFALPLA